VHLCRARTPAHPDEKDREKAIVAYVIFQKFLLYRAKVEIEERSFFVSHFAPRNSVPLTHTNTCLTPSRAVQYDWYGRHELNNPRLSRAFPGPLHRRRFRRTVSIRRALKRPRYSISPSHQQRYRECRIAPAFDTAPYRFLQCYFRIDGHAQMHSDYICSRKEEKRSRVCVCNPCFAPIVKRAHFSRMSYLYSMSNCNRT